MESKPRLIIFASGTREGGGSGFGELVRNNHTGILDADIVAVVSNHINGGVARIARRQPNEIPFEFFPGPFTESNYRKIIEKYDAKWVASSGWLKKLIGLDPRTTFNIHPGPLPRFGGKGMYGDYVHDAVLQALRLQEINQSAATMHFVTPKYDEGPVFFRYPVHLEWNDTVETIAARVNKIEHGWQSYITNLVIHEEISWDGKDPSTLRVPEGYPFL